jgi:hypothetical protein
MMHADIRSSLDMIGRLGLRAAVAEIGNILLQRHQFMLGKRFDRRHNVQTSGKIELNEVTIQDGDWKGGTRYEGFYVGFAPDIWAQLPADVSSFSFVDFGAGKGRVVLLAAELDFRKIIGVEFASELYHAMQANIQAYASRRQRCFNIEAVQLDAARFEIPDGPCVLFFFNPFKRGTLQRVVAKIDNSYSQRPRRMIIVYYNPSESNGVIPALDSMQHFRARPRLRLSTRFRLMSPFRLVVYEAD